MGKSPADTMMRIAIAGSGGLAQALAHYINETVHALLILSRQARPELEALGYQVAVVDYDSQEDLRYHLRGVDLVISTVSGHSQINLIDAAFHSRVRRFVPAEFEGPPVRRPANDPTDRGRAACLDRLRHWSHHRHPMRSTIFVCGVFYERFARGGLAALSVGSSTGVAYPGSYLMNVETNTAEVVERDGAGRPIHLVLTSINDVARFVTAAIALGPQTWPGEFRMQGDRRTVAEILQCAEAVRGAQFLTEEIQAGDLNAHLEYATYYQDWAKVARMHELIASERRGYDFTTPNLNPLVNVQPVTFWAWISQHWAGA